MGRKPNPIILEFFERGAKLNDNSNRYHHTCKACGEDFPKGRIDSLTNHLTKKCPAIPEADRAHACLTLHGISNSSNRPRFEGLLHTGPNHGPFPGHLHGSSPVTSLEQSQNQIWTPLETLAEVSRQIEANEKHDDHVPTPQDPTAEAVQTTLAAAVVPIAATANSFEPHEQFTLENPPTNLDNHSHRDIKDIGVSHKPMTAEERLRLAFEARALSPTHSALSVAVAATARLNPSLLDPQLLTDETIPGTPTHTQSTEMLIDYPPSPERQHAPPNTNESATPWDGMTYMSEDIHAPATVNDHGQHLAVPLNRGGCRMDTSDSPNGARQRHSRARFDSGRRKEVQEIRRIGACIRCRILRKTCSKGTPCIACKKVLAPRIWRTGCVRTKLSEYINLYSAGVQVVMTQKRINGYKSSHSLQNAGITLEVSHFPETGHKAIFQVLRGTPKEKDNGFPCNGSPGPVILLDNNEDIPGKVETYMRETLNEFIRREPSHYVRVTLDVAIMVASSTNDELLKRSLELWGIVEMMDRERQWTMLAKSSDENVKDYLIKDDSDCEAYTNICMQLTAAAERKASAASKVLLNGIQKHLQDGKARLGFPMFLTVMLFLNCMEKTTWAFKAWDEENLRPKWPLEKPPSSFTNQGQELTELLRMLLVIRHILPKTMAMSPESPIVANEDDPTVQNYFHNLNVTTAYLEARRDQNNFQPTDSRSLEFLFCAPLLLNKSLS
ncbi:hypothetical protein F4813DRAFT_80118 [Daldinia decipiens]|uniref:uncharacterized protein n=1 Tax=Daldinia decipiens TaxID=326647 RepID=UPI0020C49B02|nr:uncharacterized protein F4813DRAFT_80118 [Daldinia decipiens]KAI1657535.1 hypothetical protein F4813DRAFT_80118 [Daldinia decipiens]